MVTTAFRPRWVYNDGSAVDYTMSLPQRPWGHGSQALGGSMVSAAGTPESYEIRRDYLMDLVLRFPESEWTNVERLVRHLQRSGSATWYPDQGDAGTSHTVYGVSPAMGEPIRPSRTDDIGTLELAITIRRTTSTIFTDEFSAG